MIYNSFRSAYFPNHGMDNFFRSIVKYPNNGMELLFHSNPFRSIPFSNRLSSSVKPTLVSSHKLNSVDKNNA